MRDVPSQHIGKEQRGEGAVVLEQSEHRLFVDADDNGIFDGRRRGQMHRLPGETPFPEKLPGSSIAMTASLPCGETTLNMTLPAWT